MWNPNRIGIIKGISDISNNIHVGPGMNLRKKLEIFVKKIDSNVNLKQWGKFAYNQSNKGHCNHPKLRKEICNLLFLIYMLITVNTHFLIG